MYQEQKHDFITCFEGYKSVLKNLNNLKNNDTLMGGRPLGWQTLIFC